MTELYKLCEIVLAHLGKLYLDGRITKEEYESHAYLKRKFIASVKADTD